MLSHGACDLSLLDLPTATLVVIVAGLVVGALAKGTLGAGLPALGLPIMVMRIEPAEAVALFIVPVLISNIWQAVEAGHLREAARKFWPFLAMLVIGVWFGAGALTTVDPKKITLGLGCLVVCTTLAQMFTGSLKILTGGTRYINPLAGIVLGACGGATGTFAAVIVYFAALRLHKDLFISQLALAAMFGSVPLYLRLLADERLSWAQLEASTLALVPASLGLIAGFWLRSRITEIVFRRAVWMCLLLLGTALIWRGLG